MVKPRAHISLAAMEGKMHYISATQILETIPDEWIADLFEIFDNPYRAQILDWINKEHLSPEIWDLKGLKNATKCYKMLLDAAVPSEG
jgi:hypothetical protein